MLARSGRGRWRLLEGFPRAVLADARLAGALWAEALAGRTNPWRSSHVHPPRSPRTHRRRAGCAVDGRFRAVPPFAPAGPARAGGRNCEYFGAALPRPGRPANLLAHVDCRTSLPPRRHTRRVAAALREGVVWGR